jgi:hypothetical protein
MSVFILSVCAYHTWYSIVPSGDTRLRLLLPFGPLMDQNTRYNVKYVSVSCPKLYTEFSSVALGTVNVSRFILLLSVPLVSSMF